MAKGVRDVIRRAARGSSWSHFMDYASPALFEVMPMRALLAQGKEFVSNGSDGHRYAKVREGIASSLRARGLDVELGPQENKARGLVPAELSEDARRQTGDRILEIYFTQIFAGDETILDLRGDSFSTSEGASLQWRPKAFYVQWQSDFLQGLRDLYAGFYLDEEARFEAGLHRLGLQTSGDALVSHLGSGDQRSVRFETSAFHTSFHDTFLACRDRGVALHRNFLALGIYLVCLYDVLESLELEFDVRGAFERSCVSC
ncbi:MAG: hypothetical protein HKP36_05470 [Myxococcales bacterium]|nr:hypothetical protein [Deltaproteobacteria bacterium]NNL23882.1 hypothetical protein [Myxococcales bacterium]